MHNSSLRSSRDVAETGVGKSGLRSPGEGTFSELLLLKRFNRRSSASRAISHGSTPLAAVGLTVVILGLRVFEEALEGVDPLESDAWVFGVTLGVSASLLGHGTCCSGSDCSAPDLDLDREHTGTSETFWSKASVAARDATPGAPQEGHGLTSSAMSFAMAALRPNECCFDGRRASDWILQAAAIQTSSLALVAFAVHASP